MNKKPSAQWIRDDSGFTLLEMIIVVVILSIMAMVVAPRLTNFFGSRRGNFIIITSIIAKTFDDSFIKENINFLVCHLYETDPEYEPDINEKIFSRSNGISVVTIDNNGKYTDSKNRLLKFKEFSDSFKIEEVLVSTGESITSGNVLIPFYPRGYSDDAIIHILVNNEERWSIRIHKFRKEAEIIPEYIDFKRQK